MRKRLGILGFAVILSLSGCATPYQPQGLTGGFSETRLDDTTYQIRFSGNGNTSSDKVWYYWIYRCAELTKSRGYTAFALYSDKPSAPQNRKTSEATPALRPVGIQSDDNSGFANAKGGGYYYVPSYGGGTITTYSASAFVRFLKEPIPDTVSYFQAQIILDILKPYIDSDGNYPKVPARADVLKEALVLSKASRMIGDVPNSAASSTLDDYKNLLPQK